MTEDLDVTTRPVEYGECEVFLVRIEKQFGQLVKMAEKLPDHRYRFAVLHRLKAFDRAVLVTPRRKKLTITA